MGRIAGDLTGKTFSFWTVIKKAEKVVKGDILWFCECKCGHTKNVRAHGLRKGTSRSCGCMKFKGKTKRQRIWGEEMKFKDLWYHHPANNDDTLPCFSTESNFENQCAIRMGVALQRSGIGITHYRGATCTTDFNFKPECEEFHPIRVNELITFLRMKLGEPQSFKNCTFEDFVEKKGIIVFLDFWGKNMQGDHVDLWDSQSMTYGSRDYFERSREIFFWDVD